MQEATIHSTTAYPADNHTQCTFEKAASTSKGGQPTRNRKDAISPANIFQMTESHPTEYAATEELVHHPVAKISTHEPTKINTSPTLLLTMKAETIQSTTIPQADHYYQDMTEEHKILTHEPRKINPGLILLLTMMNAKTTQISMVPQADHYFQDMEEQAPQTPQHKGSQHQKQTPKIKHAPAPKKGKRKPAKLQPQNTKTAFKFSLLHEIATKTQNSGSFLFQGWCGDE
eukprot:scaffold91519_cov62-Attheya_sp.AAC.5